MRRLKVSREALQGIIALIQSLDPHPGERLSNSAPHYVVPDVLVYRSRNTWRVELNPENMPKLRINSRYAALARRTGQNGDASYLKNHLQEARWFLKSLQNRNETLLKAVSYTHLDVYKRQHLGRTSVVGLVSTGWRDARLAFAC